MCVDVNIGLFPSTTSVSGGASYRLSTCFRTHLGEPGDASLAGWIPPRGRVAALALAGRAL